MAEENRAQRVARVCPAGTVLFRDGDPGETMFVLQSGRVRLVKDQGGHEQVLAELGPGEFFGEMAILNGKARNATAVVAEDAKLLEIDGRTFGGLVTHNAEVAVRLIKRLAFRLDQANAMVEVLIHRDPVVRVVLGLARFAEFEGRDGPDGSIAITTDTASFGARLGLDEDEVEPVLRRLFRLQLVELDTHGFVVPNVFRLEEFLGYLDSRAQAGRAA